MPRFHTSRKGESVECDADEGKCPLGGQHFDTAEEATAHFESSQGDQHLNGITKSKAKDSVEVYRHPQGKVATIRNGVLEVTKDGRVIKSSATIDNLRDGHGRWTRDADSTHEENSGPDPTPAISHEEFQNNYAEAQTAETDATAKVDSVYRRHKEYDAQHAQEEGRRYYIGRDENGKVGEVYGQNPDPRGRHFVKRSEEQRAELNEAFENRQKASRDLEDRQTDIEEAGLGHTIPDDGNTVRVRSQAQKWLLKNELQGQISDGQWENTANNPYEDWSSAKVVVDPKNPGRNFHTRKDNYNLNSRSLLDAVGDRMVDDVQTRTKRPDYNEKTMRADLADLKNIFKTKRDNRN